MAFMVLAHATVIMGILSGSTILYNIQYMTMQPRYRCENGVDPISSIMAYRTCSKVEICDSSLGLRWEVDFSKEESLINWT
jgi:hypothetical protein